MAQQEIIELKRLADTSGERVAELRGLLKVAKASAQKHLLDLHRAQNALCVAVAMPYEVLALIFEQGVQTERELVSEPAQDFAGVVTRVCSKWRQIAVGKPDLWVVVWYDGNGGDQAREKIMTRLERSGVLALDIRIVKSRDGHFAAGLLRKLGRMMNRCRALQILDFGEGDRELARVISALCGGAAPQLEYLTLSAMEEDLWAHGLFPSGAPKLKVANLLGFNAKQIVYCGPCLTGITHLRLGGLTLSLAGDYVGLVRLLKSMPAVSHLEVDPLWTDVPHATLPTITLPSLRFLQLGLVDDIFCLDAALGMMVAPSLVTLVLRGWTSGGVVSIETGVRHTQFPILRRLVLQENISPMLRENVWLGASFPKIAELVLMPGWEDRQTLRIGRVFDLLVYNASEGWQQLESIALSSIGLPRDGLKLDRHLQAITTALKAGEAQIPLSKLYLARSDIEMASVETVQALENVLDVTFFRADLPLGVRERGVGR